MSIMQNQFYTSQKQRVEAQNRLNKCLIASFEVHVYSILPLIIDRD